MDTDLINKYAQAVALQNLMEQPKYNAPTKASGVMSGFQAGPGAGITKLLDYLQTSQGQTMLSGAAPDQAGQYAQMTGAQSTGAQEGANKNAYLQALKDKAAMATDIMKTTGGWESAKELKEMEQKGEMERKGMEIKSNVEEKEKDRKQSADLKKIDLSMEAGKFDETNRKELIKMVAEKDPNLALELSGMSLEQIQAAKIAKPGFWDQVGSVITTGRMSTPKVKTASAKGPGSAQYEAAMKAKQEVEAAGR